MGIALYKENQCTEKSTCTLNLIYESRLYDVWITMCLLVPNHNGYWGEKRALERSFCSTAVWPLFMHDHSYIIKAWYKLCCLTCYHMDRSNIISCFASHKAVSKDHVSCYPQEDQKFSKSIPRTIINGSIFFKHKIGHTYF